MAIIPRAAPPGPSAGDRRRQELIEKQARDYYFALAQQQFIPKDPFRIVEGVTNFARGGEWKAFCGKVFQVVDDGVLISGRFGEPLRVHYSERSDNDLFFVAHFPYSVIDDQVLSAEYRFTALAAGRHTYVSTAGGTRTIAKFEYGVVCDPPPPKTLTAEELATLKAKELARNQEAEARAFTFYSQRATNGDASAQVRLAEFYLAGRGTATNSELARLWLTRSAAAGNTQASNMLQKVQKP